MPMSKQEIMEMFLKNRLQLDSGALDFFEKNVDKVETFLERLKNTKAPSTITMRFVQETLEPQNVGIEVLSGHSKKEGRLSAQDYAQYFSGRFEVISKMIERKLALMNLVSIGKVNAKNRNFSVVGMVKEKDEDRMEATIEDTTGNLSLQFDERAKNDYKQIVLDEVIGAVCEQNEIAKASNIIWPDLPIRKEIAKADKDINCLFISDLHKCDSNFKKDSYSKFLDWLDKNQSLQIFVLGDVSHDKKDVDDFFGALPKSSQKIFIKGEIDPDTDAAELTLPNPSLVKIENVHILLSHGDFMEKYSTMWGVSAEVVMLILLKKRHINPIFDSQSRIYQKDPFLLDIVPDIFASGHFHQPCMANYKGTTILSNGSFITEPIFWTINLRNREVIKLDFS